MHPIESQCVIIVGVMINVLNKIELVKEHINYGGASKKHFRVYLALVLTNTLIEQSNYQILNNRVPVV